MLFVNRSGFPDGALMALFHWGRERLGSPRIEQFRVYGYSPWLFKGTAYRVSRRVFVRIRTGKPDAYPCLWQHRRRGPIFKYRDAWDALAYVTLHEIAHFADWDSGGVKGREIETRVDNLSKPVFHDFQTNRSELFGEFLSHLIDKQLAAC